MKKKHYFEGWYFKHVTADLSRTVSIIPGVSLTKNDPHAFIQLIDSFTGLSDYITYPLTQFRSDKKSLNIQIGSSEFTSDHLILDIRKEDRRVTGRIDFSNVVKYPGTLFSPGIMGWYSFVPFMECNHGIVTVIDDLSGRISINRNSINFDNGKGYIEKDWGSSFPEAWIWIQSNNFSEHNTSFSFSIAKIPWLGRFFIGFISYLYESSRFYLFSTYNSSVVSLVSHDKKSIEFLVQNNKYTLKVKVFKNSFGDLIAPVAGEMSRRIKESIDSELKIELFDRKDNLRYSGTGRCVGLEVVEKIFDYL